MSHLSVLAAALAPGASVACNVEGDGSGYEETLFHTGSGVSGDYSYSSKPAYDAIRDQVRFSGGEHDGNDHSYRYDIATNLWTRSANLNYGGQHAYDSNTVVEPYLYNRTYIAQPPGKFRKEHLDTGAVTVLGTVPWYDSEHSMVYFPDRDELLYTAGGFIGGISKWNGLNGGADTWTTIKAGGGSYNASATGNNIDALPYRGVIMRYIPAEHCVLILGGMKFPADPGGFVAGRAIYKYDSTGTLTRLAVDTPTTDIWTLTKHSVWWVDPVTSELLVIHDPKGSITGENTFSGSTFVFRSFNLSTLTWTLLNYSASFPASSTWVNNPEQSDCILPVPLAPYGVSMLLSYRLDQAGGQTQTLLYKHAASSPASSKLALVLR